MAQKMGKSLGQSKILQRQMQNQQEQSMSNAEIVFPHQSFEQNILCEKCETIYLIQEWLILSNINFINRESLIIEEA